MGLGKHPSNVNYNDLLLHILGTEEMNVEMHSDLSKNMQLINSVTAVKSVAYSSRSTRETLDAVRFTIGKFMLP